MAHGHDARDLHGNGDAQKRHPCEAREEGAEEVFAHQREQRDKDNRHHADDAGRKLCLGGLNAKRACELELALDSLPRGVEHALHASPRLMLHVERNGNEGELGDRVPSLENRERLARAAACLEKMSRALEQCPNRPFRSRSDLLHRLEKRLPRPKTHRHRAQCVGNGLAHALAPLVLRALRANRARRRNAEGEGHAAYRSCGERSSTHSDDEHRGEDERQHRFLGCRKPPPLCGSKNVLARRAHLRAP